MAGAVAVLLSGALTVFALVHDGRSFAIEAAVPQLELKENPYVLREDWWNGDLAAGETKLIKHLLFKRNEYWFWVGCSQETAEINVHIYDSEGVLVEKESWQKGNVAAARVLPDKTDSYYIRVEVTSCPDPEAEWAVVYAFR